MTIFLVAAFAAFGLHQFAFRLRPQWVTPDKRVLYATAVIVAGLLSLVVGGYAMVRFRSAPYGFNAYVGDILLDRLLGTLFAGGLAGILGSLLLDGILQGPAQGTLSTRGRLMVGALVGLTLLGIAGPQYLAGALSRVSKVAVAGAEINFAATERGLHARLEGDPQLPLRSFSESARLNADNVSLSMLGILPAIIKRDILYVTYANTFAHTKPDPQLITRLQDAERLTKTVIAPLGQCLDGILKETGDEETVKAHLLTLLPPISDITYSSYRNTGKFAQQGAKAFVDVMSRLYLRAYDHAFEFKSEKPDDFFKDRRANALGRACWPLTYVLCSSKPWPLVQNDIIDTDAKPDPSKAPWVRLPLSAGEQAACTSAALARPSPTLDMPKAASQKTKDLPSIERSLSTYLNTTAQAEGFKERPYLAMVSAGIYVQVGQTLAALVQLEDWIGANRARRKDKDALEAKWFELRALNTVTVLGESLIRLEGRNTSLVMRNFQIKRLDEAIALANELFDMPSEIKRLSRGRSDDAMEAIAFSMVPSESGGCDKKTVQRVIADRDQSVKFSTWYLSALASGAHHRLLHPDYASKYMHEVRRAVADLLDADFGCLVDANTRTQFRADTLRLFARMQYQNAQAGASILGRDAIERQLISGLNAATLGIRVIQADATRELEEKVNLSLPTPVLDRLGTTETIETYELLLGAKAQIAGFLSRIN